MWHNVKYTAQPITWKASLADFYKRYSNQIDLIMYLSIILPNNQRENIVFYVYIIFTYAFDGQTACLE